MNNWRGPLLQMVQINMWKGPRQPEWAKNAIHLLGPSNISLKKKKKSSICFDYSFHSLMEIWKAAKLGWISPSITQLQQQR